MKVTFDIKNQIITRTDRNRVIANSSEYLKAEVTFSEDWTGLDKMLCFKNGETEINIQLVNDKIEQESHLDLGVGTWKVYAIGVDGNQKILTNSCNLPVNASGYIGTTGPTSRLYEELLVIIQSLHSEAASEAVVRSAVEKFIDDNFAELITDQIDIVFSDFEEEIEDARKNLLGYNYSIFGNNIRETARGIWADIHSIIKASAYRKTNYFNPSACSFGYKLNSVTGAAEKADGYRVSPFIDISNITDWRIFTDSIYGTITASHYIIIDAQASDVSTSHPFTYAFYNENLALVGIYTATLEEGSDSVYDRLLYGGSVTTDNEVVATGAKYIRVSYLDNMYESTSGDFENLTTSIHIGIGLYDGNNYLSDYGYVLAVRDYDLPVASANTLGGIKVGDNLSINSNGVLSAKDSFGNIKIGGTTISSDSQDNTLEFVGDSIISLVGDAQNNEVTLSHAKSGVISVYDVASLKSVVSATYSVNLTDTYANDIINEWNKNPGYYMYSYTESSVFLTFLLVNSGNRINSSGTLQVNQGDLVFTIYTPSMSNTVYWNNSAASFTMDSSKNIYFYGNNSTKSKGDDTNQTPGFGGTFKVTSGTVDAQGHFTAFEDHTVTIPNTTATTDHNGLMTTTHVTQLNGLGTASTKDYTTSVTDGSGDLVTSGAVRNAIDAAIACVYKPAGDKTVAEMLPALLVAANLGNVYNMTTSGTTTSDFVEGSGKSIDVGDNVAVVDIGSPGSPNYKFDLLAGMVDLSAYQTKNMSAPITIGGVSQTTVESAIGALNTAKVDSETGKGLSTNDFDNTYKTKVDGIADSATKVESSTTNGNIKINGVETLVYDDSALDGRLDSVEDDLSTDTATVTGNPLNFTTLTSQKAVETVISLEPIQDLHGYDNPWAGGAWKNKLPIDVTEGEISGITATKVYDNAGNAIGVRLTGNSGSSVSYRSWSFNLSAGSYIYDSGYADDEASSSAISDSMIQLNGVTIARGNDTAPGHNFTIAEDSTLTCLLRIRANKSNVDVLYQPMIRLATETDATFAPYSNICPIDGRQNVSLEGFGKNLWGSAFDKYTGTIIAVDGTLTTNVASANYDTYEFPGGFNYAFSFTPGTGFRLEVVRYNLVINGVSQARMISSISPIIIDATNADCVRISSGERGTKADFFINPQLEIGTQPTTYEPYTPSNNLIIQFGETVYGATVDVENGTVTVTWGYIASYNGETLPGEWISDRDVYAPNTSPSTGAEVVYELATPTTIQLTPNEISLLFGVNNISTDGDTITLTYRDGKVATLGDLTATNENVETNTNSIQSILGDIAPVEQTTATQAHSVGELLLWNNMLVKVTDSIAVNDTLVLGTNVDQTTIAAELALIVASLA